MNSGASSRDASASSAWSLAIVVLAIGGPLLSLPEGLLGGQPGLKTEHLLSMVSKWVRVGAIVGIVLLGERRSLRSVGLRGIRWNDVLFGSGTLAVLLLLNTILQGILPAMGVEVQAGEVLQHMAKMPFLFTAAIAVTAGITEEVLYRGAAIERLEELVGSTAVAAALPAAVFVGAHLPAWGVGSGVVQLGYVVVFTLVYLSTRRLAPVIIAHVLLDSMGLLLVPALQ